MNRSYPGVCLFVSSIIDHIDHLDHLPCPHRTRWFRFHLASTDTLPATSHSNSVRQPHFGNLESEDANKCLLASLPYPFICWSSPHIAICLNGSSFLRLFSMQLESHPQMQIQMQIQIQIQIQIQTCSYTS